MTNLLQNYSYLEFLLLNFLGIFLGLLIRTSLVLTNQKWASTAHQTLTFCLLPVITSIITTLISSNIALSLGMIGALSIVRFRTPVKSPLELIMFFALITVGIGVAVNYKLSVMLALVIVLLIFLFSFINSIFKKRGKIFINSTYDEGKISNIIEIQAKNKVDYLDNNINLENYYYHKDENLFNYKLSFQNKLELEQLKEKLQEDVNKADIKFIDIKYVL